MLSISSDWESPVWPPAIPFQEDDWRYFVSDKVRELWPTFTDIQKREIAAMITRIVFLLSGEHGDE